MVAVCTSETMVAPLGSLTNSHCAPTVCAQAPMLLTNTPSHSHANARFFSGASADVSSWLTRSSSSVGPDGPA